MRERVRQFDGQMNIESNREGTAISLRIPLPKNGAAKEDIGTQETTITQVEVPDDSLV